MSTLLVAHMDRQRGGRRGVTVSADRHEYDLLYLLRLFKLGETVRAGM